MTSLHPGVSPSASFPHRLVNALLESFVFLALNGISKIQINTLLLGDQSQDSHLLLIGHAHCRKQGYGTEQKSAPTPAAIKSFSLCHIPCVKAAGQPNKEQKRQKQHRKAVTATER